MMAPVSVKSVGLIVTLLLLLCSGCFLLVSAADHDFNTKRVTVVIHDHCKASVVNVVPSKAPPSKFVPLMKQSQKQHEQYQKEAIQMMPAGGFTTDHNKHRGGSSSTPRHSTFGKESQQDVFKRHGELHHPEVMTRQQRDVLGHEDRRVPHSFNNWTTEHGFDAIGRGMDALSAEGIHFRYLVSFEAGLQGPMDVHEVGHMFTDPRIRFADGILGTHPQNEGERQSTATRPPGADETNPASASFFFHKHGDAEFVWVPAFVDTITLYCHNLSASVKLDVKMDRMETSSAEARGMEQQADLYYNPKVLQSTGPVSSQPNIIFISGGFTKSQETQFDNIVARIRASLEDPISSSGGYAAAPDTLSQPDAAYKVPNSVDLQNQHASVPFDRYWGMFNVFSVFQESLEAGSSYPKSGITVADNLDCYHPTTAERAVTCSVAKSVALAAASAAEVTNYPDKAIIIVVVNTYTYGGTGIFRQDKLHLCHFFKGVEMSNGVESIYSDEKYASLINHELGHAFGNLFDEYDIGISEPTTVSLLNCQAPGASGGAPSPPQWNEWITLANVADPTDATYLEYRGRVTSDLWGVTSVPTSPCGYSNYFKPNHDCMMGAVNDYYMCPVCREQSSKTIMVSESVGAKPLEYQWPRFPLPDPVLLILDDTSGNSSGTDGYATVNTGIAFHLPKVIGSPNLFDVSWFYQGNALTSGPVRTQTCPACFVLSKAIIASIWTDGDYETTHEFVANVTDNSIFISPSLRSTMPSLTQSYRFSWRIVTTTMLSSLANISEVAPASSSNAPFGDDALDTLKSYQQCLTTPTNPNPLCNLTFSAKTYEQPADLEALLAQYDQWVLYVVGGIAVVFLLLWLFAANYYSSKSHDVVRPIFKVEFQGCVSVIRKIMLFSAVMFMLATLSTMGLSVWVYLNTSALGKIIVLAGMTLASGLYIMAFIGFWAVSYRSKRLVLINGFVLFFGLIFLIAAAALSVTVGDQITDDESFWSKELEKLWVNQVSSDPAQACAIEGMLECSGYIVPCNGVVTSTVYCPVNCETTNERFATSCKQIFQDYIHANYTYILAIVFGCVGMMVMAILFNSYYYYSLRKMKKDIRDQTTKRVQRHASQKGISRQQMNNQKALLILKTLDSGDHTHLIREFRRIDADGSGELDRGEFVMFFKKALCYKPTVAEIDEIFSVADLDNSGTISLEEFLLIFDPNAIKKMEAAEATPKRVASMYEKMGGGGGMKKQNSMRRGSGKMVEEGARFNPRMQISDDKRAEIQRRANKAYGDGGSNEMQETQKSPVPGGSNKYAAPGPGANAGVQPQHQPALVPPVRDNMHHLPGGAPTGGVLPPTNNQPNDSLL